MLMTILVVEVLSNFQLCSMFEILHNKILGGPGELSDSLQQSFRIGLLLSPFTEGEIKNWISEKPAQYLTPAEAEFTRLCEATLPSINWNADLVARQPSSLPILNRTGEDHCSRLSMEAPQQGIAVSSED